MLSEAQYNLLAPYKNDIISRSMEKAKNYLLIANTIQQQLGMGSICFSCDGDKIAAMDNMYNLFKEYEQTNGIVML